MSSFAAVMVHVGVDSDARVELAAGLADRFGAVLIGIAGMAARPMFAAGGIALYADSGKSDHLRARAALDEMGGRFRAMCAFLEQVEWRSAPISPPDLLVQEARAADIVVVGPRQRRDPLQSDPGVVVLRAGRPALVVPQAAAPFELRRVVVAWKDTRECRRAVGDALPLLQRAEEVLLVEVNESTAHAPGGGGLADVGRYLERHRVVVADHAHPQAEGSIGATILRFAQDGNADLIVAGGYGHSRLGEWILGGVTQELLANNRTCCMLSH